ncbi:ABC transporter ATP-binding protein [Actinophytocola sp.]|uniref:ABC transporter ATP-binding protein n=1 Tax=Actinophytocola sp. TaxID=1872138 RepID=UPI00389988F5
MRETLRTFAELIGIGFRAAPWHAAAQLVTGIVFAVSVPVGALGAKVILDSVIAGHLAVGIWASVLLAVTVAAALASVFYYVHCLFTVQERAAALANERLMRLIGGVGGLAHHEHPDYLDQVHRIREEHHRLPGMVNATAGLLRVGAILIVTTVLLAQITPVLLGMPVLAVLSFWLGKRGRDLTVAAQEATSEPERLRRHLFEVTTSPSTAGELRVYGLATLLGERHHRISDTVLRKRNRASWQGAGLKVLDGAVNAMAYIGAIALILALVMSHDATVGDLVLVVGLAALMAATVGTAVEYGTSFLFVMKVGKRFMWLKRYAEEERATTTTEPAPVPAALRAGIELRDVHFGYEGSDSQVLNGVTLRLAPGTVVALVGDNGTGKSTLVKLLCGFYRPDAGQILVDGVDLTRFGVEEWRARCAGAFQDFARLELLVRETVGVGDLPRITDREAVGTAVARAGATSVVTALPQELETQLGTRWDGGAELSGGQWQKLALARGLMRTDPLLAVFDEPTAALDAHTEHALFENLARAAQDGRDSGTITLLVSHRFSTVGMADLIVVLDDGKVTEFGSHQELMALDSTYAALYELQSRGYR